MTVISKRKVNGKEQNYQRRVWLKVYIKAFVNELKNSLPTFGYSGSEVSQIIPEPRNFAEVTRLPADFKKAWLKSTLKGINSLINSKAFLIDNQDKGYPVTPCMDVYKAKIQSAGSLDKLKLIFVVRGDFLNKEMIGDTWYKTSSMRTLTYIFADASKQKSRVHQLYFIRAFLQDNVKHRAL